MTEKHSVTTTCIIYLVLIPGYYQWPMCIRPVSLYSSAPTHPYRRSTHCVIDSDLYSTTGSVWAFRLTTILICSELKLLFQTTLVQLEWKKKIRLKIKLLPYLEMMVNGEGQKGWFFFKSLVYCVPKLSLVPSSLILDVVRRRRSCQMQMLSLILTDSIGCCCRL